MKLRNRITFSARGSNDPRIRHFDEKAKASAPAEIGLASHLIEANLKSELKVAKEKRRFLLDARSLTEFLKALKQK